MQLTYYPPVKEHNDKLYHVSQCKHTEVRILFLEEANHTASKHTALPPRIQQFSRLSLPTGSFQILQLPAQQHSYLSLHDARVLITT